LDDKPLISGDQDLINSSIPDDDIGLDNALDDDLLDDADESQLQAISDISENLNQNNNL